MTINHLKCSGKVEVVATSPQSGQDWCVVERQVSHHVELSEFFFFRFHFYPHLRYGFTSPSLPAFLSLQATLQPQPFPWEKHCQWSWGNPTCVGRTPPTQIIPFANSIQMCDQTHLRIVHLGEVGNSEVDKADTWGGGSCRHLCWQTPQPWGPLTPASSSWRWSIVSLT